MSNLHRKLCEFISSLQFYELIIIALPHPIKTLCDHKSLLYLWARKGRLCHWFFGYQLNTSQFTNWQIFWTHGKNLVFPDLLSWNVFQNDLKSHQLVHKKIHKDIRFFNQNGLEVQNFINHSSSTDDGSEKIISHCLHTSVCKGASP